MKRPAFQSYQAGGYQQASGGTALPLLKRPRNEFYTGPKAESDVSQQQAPAPPAAVEEAAAWGEVRFDSSAAAYQALQYSGTVLGGATITVEADEKSKDGTKVIVRGLPPTLQWEVLKAHFGNCGTVLYANVKKVGLGGTPCVGAVRFETAEAAEQALGMNGAMLRGHRIEMRKHAGSKDGTKLQVFNLPSGIEWQEIKEWFLKAGVVAVFAEIGNASGGAVSAEVRYDNPEHAKAALKDLNGTLLGGGQIFITADTKSQDGSKLLVTGIPPGIEWQELKDHFNQVGQVAFAQIMDGKQKGKGSGKGGGAQPAMPANMQQFAAAMNFMAPWMSMPGMAGVPQMQMPWMGGSQPGQTALQQPMAAATPAVPAAGGGCQGEVRYDFPMHAMMAAQMLNGSVLKGSPIAVGFDPASQDGSKLMVTGIPSGTTWQELKDHFSWCGQVAFAQVK